MTSHAAHAHHANHTHHTHHTSHTNHTSHATHPDATDHHATNRPTRKTVGAAVGSAASGIAIYYVNRKWPGMVPEQIAPMFSVVATFALAWIVPPGLRERTVAGKRGRRTATAS
jgi:hypothetical protein